TPQSCNTADVWCGYRHGGGDALVSTDKPTTPSSSSSQIIIVPVHVTLTLPLSGNGTGTVTSGDANIDCPTTCTAEYLEGDTVTLTATADDGSDFLGWGGGACTGTGDCVLTLSADTDVTALFADPSTYTPFTMMITDEADDAEEFLTEINPTNPAGQVTNDSADLDLVFDNSGYK